MTIVLINPPTTLQDQQPYFPMALLTLGGALKKELIDCQLIDFDLLYRLGLCGNQNTFLDYALEIIKESQSTVFGISTICSNFPIALLLADKIKQTLPESKIILGGPQASSVPRETMEQFRSVDFVVVGEGENTLVNLLKSNFQESKLKEIKGIFYQHNNQIVQNLPQQLISNLDDLPFPDYSLIDTDKYSLTFKQAKIPFYIAVEAGRGCPFRCTFCSTKNMWEQTFRVKSPSRILMEMEKLNRLYGFTHFPFIHDNFTTSRKFVDDFCRYFIKNNHRGYTWDSSSRTDRLNKERIDLLRSAGCRGLFFGVESASEKIQKTIKKGLKIHLFEPLIQHMLQKRMVITTSFILGFSEETKEDINQTISMAFLYKKLGVQFIGFSQLAALGGTETFRKHQKDLFLASEESSISRDRPQIHFEQTRILIEKNKDLFSSFYTVPTPHLPQISFEGMGLFYTKLLKLRLPLLEILFEQKNIKPLDLYLKWQEWLKNKNSKLRIYGGVYALHLFPMFVFENYFKKQHKKQFTKATDTFESPFEALQKLKQRLVKMKISPEQPTLK